MLHVNTWVSLMNSLVFGFKPWYLFCYVHWTYFILNWTLSLLSSSSICFNESGSKDQNDVGFYNYSKAYLMTLTIKWTVKVSFNINLYRFVNNANEVNKKLCCCQTK